MLAKDISKLLSERAEEIARKFYPNGKKSGNEWVVGNIDGHKGDSLKIHLTGPKAGVWCDFATGGHKGDLLDLWAINKHQSIYEAMNDAKIYLNIDHVPSYFEKKKSIYTRPSCHFEPIANSMAAFNYLTQERGLLAETLAAYKIKAQGEQMIFPYFRDEEVIFMKHLMVKRAADGKKKMWTSTESEHILFGWHLIPSNARSVVICEGEIDAMSFYQFGIPALSVPLGGGEKAKQNWVENEIENLSRFDEILLCLDNDEKGITGTREIMGRLGAHRCRLVELPLNDANECLTQGMTSEDIKYFVANAISLDPKQLILHRTVTKKAYEILNPTPGQFLGYNLGWEKCSNSMLFRSSGLTMWTGYNGHGKSLFLSQVMLNMMRQGAKVFIASLELYPEEIMARMYAQATAQAAPSWEFIQKVDEWLDDKIYLYNVVGTADLKELLEVFAYARARYGVDVFVVDSLSTLNVAEDDYSGQKRLTEMLRDFKLRYNCHIHFVVHPRKPRDENDGPPNKYDMRGGAIISDLADNCLGVWRDKKKEDAARNKYLGLPLSPEEALKVREHDTIIKCDKNRHGKGKFKEGTWGFYFDELSGQYLEHEHSRPKSYVEP